MFKIFRADGLSYLSAVFLAGAAYIVFLLYVGHCPQDYVPDPANCETYLAQLRPVYYSLCAAISALCAPLFLLRLLYFFDVLLNQTSIYGRITAKSIRLLLGRLDVEYTYGGIRHRRSKLLQAGRFFQEANVGDTVELLVSQRAPSRFVIRESMG